MRDFVHPDPIPESYVHNQFRFQILHPRLVELDYQALMSSKDFLRRWSQSEWPRDDFSLEENLADLNYHYEEQVERIAFTYSILDPFSTTCLGCFYIKAIQAVQLLRSEKELLRDFSHLCSYWVIDKIRGTSLDEEILSAIDKWLNDCWEFPGLFFTSNPHIPEMDNLFHTN